MNFKLPDIPENKPSQNEIQEVLEKLKDEVEMKYDEKIIVLITNSSTFNEEIEKVLSYAVYLVFVGKNNFSYRLFELNCKKSDGGFPVVINAFIGPAIEFGEANTKSELEERINEILQHERSRFVILSNYRM